MHSLFSYCLANDVPVMAHTNHSNGPYEEFKALAGSAYWKLALDEFPGLRVSSAISGTPIEDHKGDRTLPFLQLMTTSRHTRGAHSSPTAATSPGP